MSDSNSSVYIQATSDYTVTANYKTQTTYPPTHANPKSILVDKSVNPTGDAKILTQTVCRSGYSNTINLLISNISNDIMYYQDYILTLARKLHLADFSVAGSEGELIFLDHQGGACNFDRDITSYQVNVNRDEEVLFLTGSFPNELDTDITDSCGGYFAFINGTRYDTLENIAIPLNGEQNTETVIVQVCHEEDISIATSYTFTIQKTDPVAIAFETDPVNAIVYLTNDLSGKRVFGSEGVYFLTPGGNYSYTVTCAGYQGITGNYTVPDENAVKTITLTEAPINTSLQQLDSFWPHLRQNNTNNGVIHTATPIQDDEALLYWATKIGDGYDKNACGCPILVDGYLYTYAGTTLYKVDTVSGSIVATGKW